MLLALSFLLVLEQKVDSCLQILLHFLFFLVDQLEDGNPPLEVVLDVVLNFLEDLALNVFPYLFRLVPPLLQPLVQSLVLAPHQNYQVEVLLRKHLRVLEIKEQSPRLNVVVGRYVADQLFLVKFRYIEFLVPVLVQLVLCDDFGNRDVLEVEGLVEQLRQAAFAGAGGPGHEDVGYFPGKVLLLDHC